MCFVPSAKRPEILLQNVTMRFRRTKDTPTSLKEWMVSLLNPKLRKQAESFLALDSISFRIDPGEIVGIIGTNGSGKSTLLKIISGVLPPSSGVVFADRRKIELLTLGTGFDVELTGRENVYLNGALIGFTKRGLDRKYDSIVSFAELSDFMDEKVRNYSSGMVSRLAFSIATSKSTPRILILDEVLSVGDRFFREKSERRIREMIQSGSTVLIVSHSTQVIRSLCTRVLWIERGKLRADGDPDTVCRAYETMGKV